MAQTLFDLRQSVLRQSLGLIGTAANATADSILIAADPILAKLFEDRNVLLTDGGTITFTGTQVQFTENLNLVFNSHVAGGVATTVSLGSTSRTFANGDLMYAVVNRSAGTATVSMALAASGLPAVTNANLEVFLIAIRKDAGDGTQRLYFRNGSALNAGQTTRLGQGGGSGSGSGTGDDLDALQFRASFADTFSENITNSNSSLNSSGTNATFNAAKSMYVVSYDASKTVTGSGTAMTMSSAPAFTVAVGDILVQGGEARKITAVATQTSYTIESAFTVVPAPSAAAATVSQAIYTKDIYNFAADGSAISAGFPGSTFSEILVDYKDTATSGSNIFVPDVAPVFAFTASNDNSSFTIVQKRPTNVTDQAQSSNLPSAGSNLYLRFFANASSGSGTANLITYKVFMQKAVSSASSTTTVWSAFGTTNSATTPVNATVGLSGGKTTISFGSNSYPVGANSGTTSGALKVWLNGQKLPRFVSGSVPTATGYFTEISATAIMLDKDYSGIEMEFEVEYSTQVIDSSSANTTAISAQQEIMQNAFQAYVNTSNLMTATSVAGTPAAGTFYSTIINRSSMPDKSQDLKARFGIDRLPIQTLFAIPYEYGASGLQVWGVPNDIHGSVRFVGTGWTTTANNQAGVSNNNTVFSSVVGDYIEATFYGTQLNVLTAYNSNSFNYDMRASVDGGSEGSNIFTANANAMLWARGYPANQVVPVVKGLTLGIHTVKIRVNNNNANIFITGLEFGCDSSTLRVNPGSGYLAGQKRTLASQASLAHNVAVTGANGGRTLLYQKADGTVDTAFMAVNSSTQFTASADHTNEEIAKTYSPWEFGSNRGDDWSSANSNGTYGFLLDDGETTLQGTGVGLYNASAQMNGSGAVINTNSSFLIFTFVGTGLDILLFDTAAGGSDSYTYSIDGASATAWPNTAGSTASRVQKIVSGLPYGTHTIRITRTTAATWTPVFQSFIVYQPKKPTLPAGALELADWCNPATYVANAIVGIEKIAKGVIRKSASREFVYIGSGWSLVGPNPSSYMTGFLSATNGNGDYVEYTFFGTGFEVRSQDFNTNSSSVSLLVDGAIPSGATSSVYGWSYNSATGVINQTTGSLNTAGAGLSISGLTLGLHTLRLTNNTTGQFTIDTIDVISPIHTPKTIQMATMNSVTVGSNSVSDNRKLTPIKDSNLQPKNSAQALGRSASPSVSSTIPVPVPDLSAVITVNSGKSIRITYVNCPYISSGAAGASIFHQIYVDGQPVGTGKQSACFALGEPLSVTDAFKMPVSPGAHQVVVYWWVTGSVFSCPSTYRNLLVEEVD